VYVDYELSRDAPPAPRGVYLLNFADPDPPLNTVIRGQSQGLLITGHTEESPESSPEDPLQVTGDRNLLTIKVAQQPLALVAMAIGDVVGVPAEIQAAETELVDADERDVAPADAILRLSPNIRLYVRVNVATGERTLLQLVVAAADRGAGPR
jgi:hypothetical protein